MRTLKGRNHFTTIEEAQAAIDVAELIYVTIVVGDYKCHFIEAPKEQALQILADIPIHSEAHHTYYAHAYASKIQKDPEEVYLNNKGFPLPDWEKESRATP